MDFYLNVLNEKERARDDNSSIGIIIVRKGQPRSGVCAQEQNQSQVAEYQLQSTAGGTQRQPPDIPTTAVGPIVKSRHKRRLLRQCRNN